MFLDEIFEGDLQKAMELRESRKSKTKTQTRTPRKKAAEKEIPEIKEPEATISPEPTASPEPKKEAEETKVEKASVDLTKGVSEEALKKTFPIRMDNAYIIAEEVILPLLYLDKDFFYVMEKTMASIKKKKGW